MIDFTGSKQNARMLIERYMDTGEQPDFMEYICFRSYYVEAKFHGYGVEYVLDNFCIYAGIVETKDIMVKETTTKSEVVKRVEHCYCPSKGVDLIAAAREKGLDFTMENGRLKLVKRQEKSIKLNIGDFGYQTEQYSRKVS